MCGRSSVSPGRADFGGIDASSDISNSNDSGDLPMRMGRPARDLEVSSELLALQSGRKRSQSWGLIMSASNADALLAYAMRTVEAKSTVEEVAAEMERAHDSLLEECLEKKREWPEKLERRVVLLELWRATPIPN